ncbi:uncharacterized protein [Aristolochia californica]|uniref:uncharacterized protein n=1 Tax=Aristolochia californica TaxID=171875 RepID=UPI0035D85B2C
MPKPICSPARPVEPAKRHSSRSCKRGQASPLFRGKPKPSGGSEISEPTSPKVTCAGQIKIKPKAGSCKNWQSVMEDIERLHNNRKTRKKPNWIETLGFKKDIMQFLTCLRSLRFDMRCFGSFHGSVLDDSDSCDEVDEDNEEEDQETDMGTAGSEDSTTIFSKWFMILQENQNHGLVKENEEREEDRGGSAVESTVPPKNALLLMRCRSAPAKGWLKDKEEEEAVEEEKEEDKKSPPKITPKDCKDKEKLLLMRYEPDFFKVSTDIAKETWVVGKSDPFSRSRSWKR